jgi:NAD-dependent SIR2 family protein deacetylase
VDGHFQRLGFENICEVHGSLVHLQCTRPCSREIWEAGDLEIHVDEAGFRATGELPHCPRCGAVARPNVLMFSDNRWVEARSLEQEQALIRWLGSLELKGLTIIEMGAGTAVPTVRYFSEYLQARGAALIRINPREARGPKGTIGIESGAKAALEAIQKLRLES